MDNNRELVTIGNLTGKILVLMELALSWVTDNKAFIYALKLQLQQNSKFPRLSAEHQICVSAG